MKKDNPIKYQDLPQDYWQSIQDYLPKYDSRDDVFHNDIMCKYLDGEDVSAKDIANIRVLYGNDIQQAFEQSCVSLYTESLKHKIEGQKDNSSINENNIVINILEISGTLAYYRMIGELYSKGIIKSIEEAYIKNEKLANEIFESWFDYYFETIKNLEILKK
jgi:hypothetical protein